MVMWNIWICFRGSVICLCSLWHPWKKCTMGSMTHPASAGKECKTSSRQWKSMSHTGRRSFREECDRHLKKYIPMFGYCIFSLPAFVVSCIPLDEEFIFYMKHTLAHYQPILSHKNLFLAVSAVSVVNAARPRSTWTSGRSAVTDICPEPIIATLLGLNTAWCSDLLQTLDTALALPQSCNITYHKKHGTGLSLSRQRISKSSWPLNLSQG